jgi:hypothetical protein
LHRWYVALIGVAFGILGFVKDGLGWDIPMPSWFWWAAALTALFVSQFWVSRDLYSRYEAMLSPEADCTLAQVVQRILEREAIREPSNAIMNALVQLRQKALSRSIQFGPAPGAKSTLEPVPADIWGTSQVDFIGYLEDERGKLEATKGITQAKYMDFRFNREQIARYWPKRSFPKRLALRARWWREGTSHPNRFMQLILKRAASRPSGDWSDDDYDVLADDIMVGRIMKTAAKPADASWLWTLAYGQHGDRTPTHGYEATREEAMAASAKSWRRE